MIEEAHLLAQLKIELEERGILQQDMADSVGVSQSAFNRYMKGNRHMPMATFLRVAEVLGELPSDLWRRAERHAP